MNVLHVKFPREKIPSPGWYYHYRPVYAPECLWGTVLLAPSCLEDRSKLRVGIYEGPLTKEEEKRLALHSWEWHEEHPNATMA